MNARTQASIRRGSTPRSSLVSLLVTVGATLLVFAGCGLNTHGLGMGGNGGEGGSVPCNVDSQCDDDEPCTKDTCGPDRLCMHAALADGPAPDAVQAAGDCKTIVCKSGKHQDQDDDNDVSDDHQDCTIDTCQMGVVHHTPKPGSPTCDDGMGNTGRCDPQGKCLVACTSADQCASTNPCVIPACDTAQGQCVTPPPPVADGTPTPGVAPVVGDCKVHICVMGTDTAQVDDSDVPKTATDCDEEVCTNGTPSNPPKPTHNPCSTYNGNMPGVCDGAGACVECTQDTDCTGPTTDCQHPACTNHKCGPAYTTAMTPTTSNPPQVAGDCQTIVCDGAGGTMLVPGADPLDDNNACTTDTCAGQGPNMTTYTNVADGTHCGTGGTLACVAGSCNGCTSDGMCQAASCSGTVLTKAQTCDTKGSCQSHGTQDCSPFNCVVGPACPTTCNTDGDCIGGYYCTGAGGTCVQKITIGLACASNHQCASGSCADGVCCNTACNGTCVACTAAKKGSGADGTCGPISAGTDPDNECTDQGVASCGTDGTCDGAGACRKYASGTVCQGASCAGNTLTKAKSCVSGACTAPSPATQGCAPYVCATNACTTSCAVDTDCASGNYCNGGTCVAKLANGSACTGVNQCTSGNCVDGFCCGTACTGACQACSAAKKQSGAMNGTCGAAKDGQLDPRGSCATTAQSSCGTDGKCSGGACEKYPSGTMCAGASCSGSTQTAAKTCDGTGNCNQGGASSACPGGTTCNTGAMMCYANCLNGATPDDTRCVAGDYCDATGACKPKIAVGGMGCMAGSQCGGPGICGANGVCCSGTCTTTGTCGADGCVQGSGACHYPGSTTSCGTPACAGGSLTTSACNGSGSCVAGSPSACPGGFVCASASACLTTCGTDVDCVTADYCDVMGACQPKSAPGGVCTANHECTSTICDVDGMGNCCATACSTTDATCGATSCNGTGACVYPDTTVSCGASTCSGSTLTTSTCSGTGTCTPSVGPCPGGFACANGSSCSTSCGMANGGGDNNCASNYYCDGVGGGACQQKKPTGAACSRPAECVVPVCAANICG